MTRYHFKRISGNKKTGPIPVTTTSGDTCPPDCRLFAACYAKNSYHLELHWQHVNNGTRGDTLENLCLDIRKLPGGQLFRLNQAGDLPGRGADLDTAALEKITRASRGRRGFTYTHKHTNPANIAPLKRANAAGLIINLSADNAAHADELAAHGLPLVTVIPIDAPKVTRTPRGRKVVLCPAESSARITCSNCGLCAQPDRPYIIGFKAKGGAKRAADIIARGTA